MTGCRKRKAVACRTDASLQAILGALFPAASITGAPKPHTMQIIAELENTPRNIYTGTVGFVCPPRRAQFNVAIRTVLVEEQTRRAEYGVGGGIIWDSDPGGEFDECCTKAALLSRPARLVAGRPMHLDGPHTEIADPLDREIHLRRPCFDRKRHLVRTVHHDSTTRRDPMILP